MPDPLDHDRLNDLPIMRSDEVGASSDAEGTQSRLPSVLSAGQKLPVRSFDVTGAGMNDPGTQGRWPGTTTPPVKESRFSIIMTVVGIAATAFFAAIAAYVSMFQQPLADVKSDVDHLLEASSSQQQQIETIEAQISSIDNRLNNLPKPRK